LNALDDGKSHEVNHYSSVSHVWQITSFIYWICCGFYYCTTCTCNHSTI